MSERFAMQRLWTACLLTFALMSGTAAARTADEARAKQLEQKLSGPDGTVMVVAHRGCWKHTSENSIDSIENCIAFGIDMVELDVRATRDGVLVLMHDATVDRTTDGTGAVEELDWAYLRTLRLREGAGRGSALTERRIPTLAEALAAAKDRVLINIDSKTDMTGTLLAQVDAYGSRKQVLFKASARPEALPSWIGEVVFQPIIRERDMTGKPEDYIPPYDGLRPVGYEIDVLNPSIIASLRPAIQQRCRRFWVNSLNGTRSLHDNEALRTPEAVWGRMIADGVDTIQTDEPLALKAFVAGRGITTFRCPPQD